MRISWINGSSRQSRHSDRSSDDVCRTRSFRRNAHSSPSGVGTRVEKKRNTQNVKNTVIDKTSRRFSKTNEQPDESTDDPVTTMFCRSYILPSTDSVVVKSNRRDWTDRKKPSSTRSIRSSVENPNGKWIHSINVGTTSRRTTCRVSFAVRCMQASSKDHEPLNLVEYGQTKKSAEENLG